MLTGHVLTVSAQAPIANIPGATPTGAGGTGTTTTFTQGSVVFAGASGIYSQDAAFVWDATNHCLAIGSGNSGCAASGALRVFRNTAGLTGAFVNTNTGTFLKIDSNNVSGAGKIQVRNVADSVNLPLELQSAGGDVLLPAQPSTTGQRFVCIDTTGKLISSASACIGT